MNKQPADRVLELTDKIRDIEKAVRKLEGEKKGLYEELSKFLGSLPAEKKSAAPVPNSEIARTLFTPPGIKRELLDIFNDLLNQATTLYEFQKPSIGTTSNLLRAYIEDAEEFKKSNYLKNVGYRYKEYTKGQLECMTEEQLISTVRTECNAFPQRKRLSPSVTVNSSRNALIAYQLSLQQLPLTRGESVPDHTPEALRSMSRHELIYLGEAWGVPITRLFDMASLRIVKLITELQYRNPLPKENLQVQPQAETKVPDEVKKPGRLTPLALDWMQRRKLIKKAAEWGLVTPSIHLTRHYLINYIIAAQDNDTAPRDALYEQMKLCTREALERSKAYMRDLLRSLHATYPQRTWKTSQPARSWRTENIVTYLLAVKEELLADDKERPLDNTPSPTADQTTTETIVISEEDMRARNSLIWMFYNEGRMTYNAIASAFSISTERVRQIVVKVERRIAWRENKRIRASHPPYEGQMYTVIPQEVNALGSVVEAVE